MVTALKQPLNDMEKSSAYIYLGLLYSDLKDFKKASDNFHIGLSILEHQEFRYSPNFNRIIKIFIKNGELEKAAYWLDNLTGRKSFDKKFSKLDQINSCFKEKR